MGFSFKKIIYTSQKLSIDHGNSRQIFCCVLDPSGKYLALGGRGKFWLFDLEKKKDIYKIFNYYDLKCLAFSRDGALLACGFYQEKASQHAPFSRYKATDQKPNETILIRDGKTGKKVKGIVIKEDLRVYSCSFNSNGRLLATAVSKTGVFTNSHQVIIWDIATGKPWKKLPIVHQKKITACHFSPGNDNIIVTSSEDINIIVWDIKSNVIQKLSGHKSIVTDIAFTPSGKEFLSVGNDNRMLLWDMATRDIKRIFYGHVGEAQTYGAILNCAISPKGTQIATNCYERDKDHKYIARVWSLKTKPNPFFLYKNKVGYAEVEDIKFAPDNSITTIHYGSNKVCLWDADSGKQTKRLSVHLFAPILRGCSFSQDGKYLAVAGHRNNLVLFDAKSKSKLMEFGVGGQLPRLEGCSFNETTTKIAAYSNTPGDQMPYRDFVAVWDMPKKIKSVVRDNIRFLFSDKHYFDEHFRLRKNTEKKRHESQGKLEIKACFFVDNKVVAIFYGGLVVWDLEKNTCHTPILLDGYNAAALSSDRKLLVLGSVSGDLTLVKTSNLQTPIKMFSRPAIKGNVDDSGAVNACVFTPNSKRIICAYADGSVRVWQVDAVEGKNSQGKPFNKKPTANKKAVPWIHEPLLNLKMHSYEITAMALSKDGSILATGDDKGNIKIWKTK